MRTFVTILASLAIATAMVSAQGVGQSDRTLLLQPEGGTLGLLAS
jgi:hypothetical protein